MNKSNKKTDKVTSTILVAFMLMSGTHFACRYDISAIVDDMFKTVSAETVLPTATAPEPIAVAPAVSPTSTEEIINAPNQKTITRNPFAVPVVAQNRQSVQIRRQGSSTSSASLNSSSVNISAQAPINETPRLKGVVQSGNKSMAIIEYKGSSSAYRPGQSVGGYTVSNIGSASANLSGASGSVRITVGG